MYRTIGLILALGAPATAGCFDKPEPDVAFLCGEDDACPEGYECRDDGCCHLIGSPPAECPGDEVDVDAGPDGGADDAGPDAMTDAAPDAMADAAPDAMPDAMPTIAVQSLMPASTIVTAGDTVDLTVTIDMAAPTGGTEVMMSSDSAAATVPSPVTVPQGNTTAQVTVTGMSGGEATITATLNGTATANVTVAATTAAAGDVIFTEFIALTSSGTNDGELVELVNTGQVTVDISGWMLTAGTTTNTLLDDSLDTTAPVYVAPGQNAYGVPNPNDSADIPGDADFVYGTAGAALEMDDAGTAIDISDGTTTLDTVDFSGWETTGGATPTADQFAGLEDRSTQLAAGNQDATANDDGASWCVPEAPTPGSANADCTAIVVNELLPNPTGTDTDLEFVELHAVAGAAIGGHRVRSTAADGTPTGADVTLAAGSRAPLDGLFVIGDNTGGTTQVANADLEANLGLPDPDGAVQLLDDGNALLDAVGYGTLTATVDTDLGLAIVETTATESAEGSSTARDASATDTDDNSADFHLDPTPTPGADNDAVQVAITTITPDDGLASTTAAVTITGADFRSDATVTVGGTAATCTVQDASTIDCTFPDNGGTAAAVDVTVANPGGTSDTAAGGFTYTGVLTDASMNNDVSCSLVSPVSMTTAAGAGSGDVLGWIFESGNTDASNTAASGITGEVGYGADGSDPQTVNWTWFAAMPDGSYDFAQDDDQYVGSMTAPLTTGSYDYAYRFSLDGGLNWYYCDDGGQGSDDDYQTTNAGDWTVN